MSTIRNGRFARELDERGFCVVPHLVPVNLINCLKQDLASDLAATPFCEGNFYGYRTKRVGGLPRRTRRVAELILEPFILELANSALLGACDRIQLNVAQLIEIHPGEVQQFPHRDDDMWPVEKNGTEYLLNVIWPLDRFTTENGATRLYPGSHRRTVAHLDDLGDPEVAECDPGSALCFLGSTIHGAGANSSPYVRRAIVIGYSLGWLRPHENPSLAYPPNVAKHFPPALAELAGYVQHRPNLGNYEGRCPSYLLTGSPDPNVAAIDALRPDQSDMVSAFARSQRTIQ